ncbi:unnamed protein product, partial [Cylicocyclus nassatus]
MLDDAAKMVMLNGDIKDTPEVLKLALFTDVKDRYKYEYTPNSDDYLNGFNEVFGDDYKELYSDNAGSSVTNAVQFYTQERLRKAAINDGYIAQSLGFRSLTDYYEAYPEAKEKYNAENVRTIKREYDRAANNIRSSFSMLAMASGEDVNYANMLEGYDEKAAAKYDKAIRGIGGEEAPERIDDKGYAYAFVKSLEMAGINLADNILSPLDFFVFERDDAGRERDLRNTFSTRNEARNYIEYAISQIPDEAVRNAEIEKFNSYQGDIYDYNYRIRGESVANWRISLAENSRIVAEELATHLSEEEEAFAYNAANVETNIGMMIENAALVGLSGGSGIAGIAGASAIYGLPEGADLGRRIYEKTGDLDSAQVFGLGASVTIGTLESITDAMFTGIGKWLDIPTFKISNAYIEKMVSSVAAKFPNRIPGILNRAFKITNSLTSLAGESITEGLQEAIEYAALETIYYAATGESEFDINVLKENAVGGVEMAPFLKLFGSGIDYVGKMLSGNTKKAAGNVAAMKVAAQESAKEAAEQLYEESKKADIEKLSAQKMAESVSEIENSAEKQAVEEAKAAFEAADADYNSKVAAQEEAKNTVAELAQQQQEAGTEDVVSASEALAKATEKMNEVNAAADKALEARNAAESVYKTADKVLSDFKERFVQSKRAEAEAEINANEEAMRARANEEAQAKYAERLDKVATEYAKKLAGEDATSIDVDNMRKSIEKKADKIIQKVEGKMQALKGNVEQMLPGWKVVYDDTLKSADGYMDPRTQQIVLKGNNGKLSLNSLKNVVVHELVHVLKSVNQSAYDAFEKTILDAQYKGNADTLAADIRAKIENYKTISNGKVTLDENTAREEVVAELAQQNLFGKDILALNRLVLCVDTTA